MSKKDKYWYVPWIGVVISALILGAVGRYIALKVSEEPGTATLTFIIVVLGVIFLCVLFIVVWETIRQAIFKKPQSDKEIQQVRSEEKEDKPQQEQDVEAKPGELSKLPEDSALQQKIAAFCKYSDNILAGYVTVEDLPLLHKYIEQYANENLGDITQRIKTHTVDTFDLCHYGWNIWNHFGKVVGQEETGEWLKTIFEQLKDISPNTIHKKFTHKERMTYIIPIEIDIK